MNESLLLKHCYPQGIQSSVSLVDLIDGWMVHGPQIALMITCIALHQVLPLSFSITQWSSVYFLCEMPSIFDIVFNEGVSNIRMTFVIEEYFYFPISQPYHTWCVFSPRSMLTTSLFHPEPCSTNVKRPHTLSTRIVLVKMSSDLIKRKIIPCWRTATMPCCR